MAFGGGKKAVAPTVSARRLAAVAGAPDATVEADSSSGRTARRSLEPDLSRIRPRITDSTPEERKRRLAAKTVNFTATIIARIVIISALGLFLWNQYQFSGQVQRGAALGLFAVLGDLGRVIMKAMEPGTR